MYVQFAVGAALLHNSSWAEIAPFCLSSGDAGDHGLATGGQRYLRAIGCAS
jgi:hypothetical protein